ncbi:MAG: Ig-like domain-containing protein [Bacteroidales bacterium]
MMKKIAIILLIVFNSSSILAQTILTIEGTVVNNTEQGTWEGVNIPRNQPTTFTYQNNSITSVNASGYMLQAGDESPLGSNNNLDGEIISGNIFTWNGTDPTSITHGAFTGYNINAVLKYNYLYKVPMGLIRKSNGMTNTAGGVAYNIVNNSQAVAAVVKGINGVSFFNNTFYSDQVMYAGPGVGTWRGIVDIYSNTDDGLNAPSTGTKIKNNIFYTKHQIFNIYIYDAACLPGFESDYNVYYCEEGTPIFNYLGTSKTFSQWQALGYDTHSIVLNPNFIDLTDFVPASRLNYGTNLGTSWQTGLSISASWNAGSAPATTNQNGTWQVGARIYSSQIIPVSGISVTGAGGSSAISTDNGSLQLSASVLPDNATDKTVSWSVINGTGQSTISSNGLVTAVDNGTVTARATANDGSGVYGTLVISITNQIVPVASITVTGAGGATTINADKGSLQLSASILPADATNNIVIWSIINGSGQATINSTGLVTAIDNGTVTARATANDGSGVFGTLVIMISNQIIPVSKITVTGAGGASIINTDNGSLQLSASVFPVNATDKTVTWSIVNRTGRATINATGLVTAIDNGIVTARATANDGSGVYDTLVITNSNQVVSVTGIIVSGAGGATTITTDNGSLQLSAAVLPSNATDKTLSWSIVNGTGLATINSTGLVTASDNGTVTVRATANDGSGIYGTMVITISNQIIPVTSLTVIGAGGATAITIDDGSLQMSAAIVPVNATTKTVTWSLDNGDGLATISPEGLITAVDNGTVTVRATANDGSGVFGALDVLISNQIIHVSSLTVSGAAGATTITIDKGSLQLSAAILPVNATNKTVTWSVINGTGQATINSTGLLVAVDNGTVTARATANDGSGVYGTMVISISNQIISVTSITLTGAGNATIITTFNGTLQLNATVLPVNATDKTVTWSIVNGTGQATVNSIGLVTAVDNGTVTAIATANDGSGIYGTLVITINTSLIPVTGITVTGAGGETTITTNLGSLHLSDEVLPSNATDKIVTWSLVNETGSGTINSTGLVTAVANGTIIARATANDGSGVYGTLVITISNQIVPVSSITISGAGGATTIVTDNGSLQLISSVLPVAATDNSVTWSIVNGTGQASINATGVVTAIDNGTVTAIATANDGSGVFGSLVITISNQIVPVTGISIAGAGGATTITTDNGSLQLSANILPSNATDKTITWSLVNGTGKANISTLGLVSAIDNGTVTARATANDGSGVYGTLVITISNQVIPVTGITISGAGGVTTITVDDGSLQLSAEVLPSNATDNTVTWSLVNGTGLADINSTGLVTAMDNGTVTVRATANDGSDVSGTMVIDISNQIVPVTGISVTGTGGATSITNDNGTLQLVATVSPGNATNNGVTWSLINGTGQAVINVTGRVTAVDNGTVTARATAKDGSGVYGTLVITISNQVVPVTGISISGAGGATTITDDNGTLQLSEAVLPANATDKTVTWSLVNGTGQAIIDDTGLVTAVDNGTVTARATANDGSGIYGTLVIIISNQIVPVTGITVTGSGGATIITADNGSLQLSAAVIPADATNKTVTWSLVNGTGQATISATGLISAVDNGTVTATATANDGSGVFATLTITIFNQVIPVTGITVSGAGGLTSISSDNGTLQLSATVLPANATDKAVTWTLINGTGLAFISADGIVTAIDNGTVTARATSSDGSGVYGNLVITISNQIGPVTNITVTGAGGATTITTDNGTLQLSAAIIPANATVKTVTWSFVNGSGLATINSNGLVTAINNGTVTVKATANDGSGVYGTIDITISNQIVPVTGITITTTGGINTISTNNGTLQLNAAIQPVDATNKTVNWSIVNGTGLANIDATGLVTAIDNGIITVNAAALDGSGVYGVFVITISNQVVPVTSIIVTGAGGSTSITDYSGSLQLIDEVSPQDATEKAVTWSLISGSEHATINSTGLVTALDNGIVTAMATAIDGSGVNGTMDISISGQEVPVAGITVTGAGSATTITGNNGVLQLKATVFPPNATDKTVTWSLISGIGLATISSTGLVMAIDNGSITAMATANDGSGIYGLMNIPIIIDNFELTSIIVTRNEIKIQLNDNYISWKASLYNIQGVLAFNKLVVSDIVVFDISLLPSGIYLVVLSKGENLRVRKVIKP